MEQYQRPPEHSVFVPSTTRFPSFRLHAAIGYLGREMDAVICLPGSVPKVNAKEGIYEGRGLGKRLGNIIN